MSQHGTGYRFATEDAEESKENFDRFMELMHVLDAKKKQLNDEFHAAQMAAEKAREDANNMERSIKREINQINTRYQNGESLADYIFSKHIKPDVVRSHPAPPPPARLDVPDFFTRPDATPVRSTAPNFARSAASPTLTFAPDGSERRSSIPFRGSVARDQSEFRGFSTFHAHAASPPAARRRASSAHSDAYMSFRQSKGQYKYSEDHPLIVKNPSTGRGWMEVWCKFCGSNTNAEGKPFADLTRLMLHLQNGHRAELKKLSLTGRLDQKQAIELCCDKSELTEQQASAFREARENLEFDPDVPRSHKRRRTTTNYAEGLFDTDV